MAGINDTAYCKITEIYHEMLQANLVWINIQAKQAAA